MFLAPKVYDMNLLTMFLNSWDEESRTVPGLVVKRTSIKFLDEVVDELVSQDYIAVEKDFIIFNTEGERRAERFKGLYY